ncbi:ARM repeat-containing protein [Athelia psychrophila]|uniref:ARM repeat-containing protein n=1 Tax=Athelia psychrophila TaxID=1759441 RepID=A0A166ISV2_9AGAM|nr:ARM repeat-containing protein [Fibularhizoctonia sp. CBS 109695]
METSIARQLVDKIYEKRKSAALDLEKQIRECHAQGDQRRISQIIDQLVEMFSNPSNPLHIRNGGLIGLAGTAIALGVDIAPYMEKFVDPLLVCFTDPENRIRYFSAECLYNIAKVSKGEILVYFNPIFDALSKLAADSELSVKNGAELLDRLLKDIVAESASVYIPQYAETEKIREMADEAYGILVPYPADMPESEEYPGARRAFSLAHFIPLLSDRIYVVSPFTRSYLVSWITVLDSVPELELISFLPEFFDGLLKYLSDPLEDVRVATETLLADFLREIRDVSDVRRRNEERAKFKREKEQSEPIRRPTAESEKLPDITLSHPERAAFLQDHDGAVSDHEDAFSHRDEVKSDIDQRDSGAWVPGQGVRVDYSAIVEILLMQLDSPHDEIQQSTALRWLAEFLHFAPEVMVPFTPRLIPAILPNLDHHVAMIQGPAIRTNKALFNVVQNLPSPAETRAPEKPAVSSTPAVPNSTPARPPAPGKESVLSNRTDGSSDEPASPAAPLPNAPLSQKSRGSTMQSSLSDMAPPLPPTSPSRPQSPHSGISAAAPLPPPPPPPEQQNAFDYQATVNELTIQFLSEHEDTRVAALKWLIMLHQKAPKDILAMDDGTFPALLKTLSDSSEEVIKHDLQLLAQISSSSEESYFKAFMMNLLELFSTDRRLLETRGSLIIRQLCLNLNTERIYRKFAEILEKEEDLEFASVIVQKLNIILITSPELADFRKRLKSLETRQDGQALFTTLYRSWCHNAVAVFSLCLLAQAYEHASNLLSIFADLEITVQMLVQVDKLVQLIESPVFTYLRLQLLEPERYPYLFKCLYGLLMLLPQSSAFVSLRNRLNAVNSAGFLQIAPKSAAGSMASRSKIGRDDIKWQELLLHFRSVQGKHEKARRTALGAETAPFSGFSGNSGDKTGESSATGAGRTATGTLNPPRPQIRRRITGNETLVPNIPPRNVLSPLNPRRGQAGYLPSALGPQSPTSAQPGKAQPRVMNVSKKA